MQLIITDALEIIRKASSEMYENVRIIKKKNISKMN